MSTPGDATTASAMRPRVDAVTMDEDPRTSLAWLGWTAVTIGVAGVGLGVAGLAIRESDASDWNDDSRCLVAGRTREENCGDIRSRVQTWDALSTAGFILGGLGLAAGITILALEASDDDDGTGVALSCGGGLTSVECTGRF